jgi:hypothetical protein
MGVTVRLYGEQLCYAGGTVMLWEDQLCNGRISYALGKQLCSREEQLCHGRNSYAKGGTVMPWEEQLCYGRNSYAIGETVMLREEQLGYGRKPLAHFKLLYESKIILVYFFFSLTILSCKSYSIVLLHPNLI